MSIATQECATKRAVRTLENFKIYKTLLGGNQLYITASITNFPSNAKELSFNVYSELIMHLKADNFKIIHERIFAGLEFLDEIIAERSQVFLANGFDDNLPYTFIQGNPIYGSGLAGIQIRAFKPTGIDGKVETIFEGALPVGRKWSRAGAHFVMLQNIFGDLKSIDRYHQACDMFDRTQKILEQESLTFQHVLRTWIYLAGILDWYGEFNRARNARFAEFGLLGQSEKENREAEQIYLPASTGILGENPIGAVGTMDVLAMPSNQKNVSIAHTSGTDQKSPYRYGSAFSRAMTLKESDITHILLSGTASIDEHGKTVFIDNAAEQIRKTLTVVQSLIREEGATLQDINEATVFFKKPEDYDSYEQVIEDFDNIEIPTIFIVADVCRDDLLFEIDAAIAF